METMNKEVVEKRVYMEGDKHHRDNDRIERKASNGFGTGLAGVITGGLALLSQGGRGLFGGLLNGGCGCGCNEGHLERYDIYKTQAEADFGLYKVSRDLYDTMNDKLNTAAFGLYRAQRDAYDVLNERYADKFNALDKKVAVLEAIRPYQDRLLQCEIDRAYVASINHCDRLDCRNIKGVVTLPSTPTVTGYPSSCGCQQPNQG